MRTIRYLQWLIWALTTYVCFRFYKDFPKNNKINNFETDNHQQELDETLQRRANGRAAVIIIRVENGTKNGHDDEPRYLVQRKSEDYPIQAFQNAICLFGGNAKLADKTPLETLQRELKEELPPELVHKVMKNPSVFNLTLNSQTAEMINKTDDYAFACASYQTVLSFEDLPSNFSSMEGSYALLTKNQLLTEESYAWGYDHIMSTYFQEPVRHFAKGASVSKLDINTLKNWNLKPSLKLMKYT